MKPIFRLTAIIALLLVSVATQAQRRNSRYNEYIKQYAPLAVEQMKEHKIPGQHYAGARSAGKRCGAKYAGA